MRREEDGLRDGAARVAARADKAVDQAACMDGTTMSATTLHWYQGIAEAAQNGSRVNRV